MASIRQPSFAGGELAPLLQGRHDLDKYAIGLKKARNFFISRQGAAVSRPGTTFVGEVKDSTKRVRLVPFVFSDEQAFVLEFGYHYIRYYRNGVQLDNDGDYDGDPAYETATSYEVADLPRLKFAQAGDVITIAHQGYPPAELKRITATTWSFNYIGFAAPSEAAGAGDTFTVSYTVPGSFSAWSNVTTYAAGDLVAYGGANWLGVFGANVGNTPGGTNGYWLQIGSNSGREWAWAVTGLIQIGNVVVESAPVVHSPGAVVPLSSDSPAVLTVAAGAGAGGGATQYQLWGVRIYRGVGGVYGFIGAMTAVGDFTDSGQEPDYTQAPPQSADPFTLYTPGAGPFFYGRTVLPVASTDYPACVAIFEQRRCFADTPSRPAFVLTSETDNYYKYDDALIPVATSPMRWELASRELAQIRTLIPVQKLVAFTNSGVWSISGSGGSPLAFDSIDCKVQTELGASWLTPLVVDDSILYARSKGTGVRELVYDFMHQKFSVGDATVYSEHLFIGRQVVDWAYAEDPWQLVWAVMDNGQLVSFSYMPQEQVRAWTWHDTDGTYENVCSVPNGTVDDVYFVVNRTINGTTKRYIERHSNRVFTEATATAETDIICVDCALTRSGSATTTISGLSHLEAKSVYGLADGGVVGPLVVASGAVTLPAAAEDVVLGLAYTPELQQLSAVLAGAEVHSRQKSVRRVTVDVYASRGLKAGPDFDHLTEWRQRRVSEGLDPLPLETDAVQLNISSTIDTDASVCIRQTSPLPLTVVGITREVEFGDD